MGNSRLGWNALAGVFFFEALGWVITIFSEVRFFKKNYFGVWNGFVITENDKLTLIKAGFDGGDFIMWRNQAKYVSPLTWAL
jgi:hypothetical protein